jgi:hypothetical protein
MVSYKVERAVPCGADEGCLDKITFWFHGRKVNEGKWIVSDRVLDWSPDVDETDSTLQKLFGIRAQISTDTTNRRGSGLVDVDSTLYIELRLSWAVPRMIRTAGRL